MRSSYFLKSIEKNITNNGTYKKLNIMDNDENTLM